MKAETALFAVARLETFKRDAKARVSSKLRQATGFFYRTQDGRLSVVTNKHVIYDRNEHYFPDRLRIHVHSDPLHWSKMKHIDLRVWSKDGKKLWKWFPNRPIDVIAVDVPTNQLKDCFFVAFSKTDMMEDGAEPLPGKDIDLGFQALVMGYPLDFYDKNTFLPMTRAATIATWPWLNFERKPCFLIDARVHPGMSGSPVILSPGTIKMMQDSSGAESAAVSSESYLLGVVSDERTPWGEPLGLNTVWHANTIRDLVNDK
jgi:hypothetical protein